MMSVLFLIWAFILPLFLWGEDFLLNQNLRQEILSVPLKKKKNKTTISAPFPTFCQDVILMLPIVGVLLIMWVFIVNNLGYDQGYPKSSQLFGYLCLIQLSILDLVRGLKMRLTPKGDLKYNWHLFFGTFLFTLIHIATVNYLMYSWDISLLCLIILSVISSIKTWQYIEKFYKGK